jgi:hypothetical protein
MGIPCELATSIHEQQLLNRKGHAVWACIVWLVSGLYLYVMTPGASLLSCSAAVFFSLGLLAAAFLVGGLGYSLRCVFTPILARLIYLPVPGGTALLVATSWLLLGAETAVGFQSARTAFDVMTGT